MEQKLIENMAEILEVDLEKLSMSTAFKTDEFEWDSLKGYAMIVMIEEEFGKIIPVNDFIKAKTIQDLFNYINN